MSATLWVAFALAYTVMAAAPGPVVLLVVTYALGHGRRTSLSVVAGTVLGDATCLAAAVCGAGAVLAASATAFVVLKLAGAAYLVFLGVCLWRAAPAPPENAPSAPRSLLRVFVHAYLATIFNPKSILFFMVFVPQFIDPEAALLPQLAEMVASVLICGALVDGSYSVFATKLRRLIRAPRAQRIVNKTAGGFLVGEGILAAAWRAVAL